MLCVLRVVLLIPCAQWAEGGRSLPLPAQVPPPSFSPSPALDLLSHCGQPTRARAGLWTASSAQVAASRRTSSSASARQRLVRVKHVAAEHGADVCTIGDFALDGRSLRLKGVNRIGNLLVPNDNYVRATYELELSPGRDTWAGNVRRMVDTHPRRDGCRAAGAGSGVDTIQNDSQDGKRDRQS
jgi:hypothetical protein